MTVAAWDDRSVRLQPDPGDTMPFKSQAQRRKFAQLLVEGKISPETFEEWNRETGAKKLPERAARKRAAGRKTTARKAGSATRTRARRARSTGRTRRK
jgi:hypothetical protein